MNNRLDATLRGSSEIATRLVASAASREALVAEGLGLLRSLHFQLSASERDPKTQSRIANARWIPSTARGSKHFAFRK